MAVSVHLTFNASTLEDYRAVMQELDFANNMPEGLRTHYAWDQDGHLEIADVWDTPEQFQAFAEDRMGPAIGKVLGDKGNPPDSVEVRELESFYV